MFQMMQIWRGGLQKSPTSCSFPSGIRGKESAHQCRKRKRHEFDPWVKKIPWRRKQQPTPIFLPEESHGQRSLVGYSLWGHKESDVTEVTQHACIHLLPPHKEKWRNPSIKRHLHTIIQTTNLPGSCYSLKKLSEPQEGERFQEGRKPT